MPDGKASKKSDPGKRKRSRFSKTFWVANTMEIFERMAWYGFYAVSSLYITGSVEEGALGFTSEQRGALQGIVTFILYLLPVLTGALADRYGYRKTFLLAFGILTPSYYLLGQFHSYTGFFLIFLLVAIGAAIFKPVVVGTVARTTNEETSSVGFGIFYMMVNIGGFLGPIVAGIVRGWDWNLVFIMSAVWIGLNFIPVLFFYDEPTTEADSASARTLRKVIADTVLVLGNWRFMLFLVILSGFWTVFNQLFMTMPEYIRDFVDTTDILLTLRNLSALLGLAGASGKLQSLIDSGWQVNPEYMINVDAGSIIAFQVLVSLVMKRFRPFFTIIAGTTLLSIGVVFPLFGSTGWVIISGIVVFSFGEMAASPKSQEYIGRIAPQDKVALFMGYYFVTIALGNLFGGLLSGFAYGKLARDMQRPDLMWLLFMGLGFLTAFCLYLYDRLLIKNPE
ncbi:MAG: MFS transporter [Candidatus Glassbacteria bacterium]